MNRLRLKDNFTTRPDDRANDQPLTPADLRLRAWVRRALIAYLVAALAVGVWALSVLIEGVL